jgi:hypothetical protein
MSTHNNMVTLEALQARLATIDPNTASSRRTPRPGDAERLAELAREIDTLEGDKQRLDAAARTDGLSGWEKVSIGSERMQLPLRISSVRRELNELAAKLRREDNYNAACATLAPVQR